MLKHWLPWRWLIRALARAHGLLDPLAVLARLDNLAQPSEVAAPIELLRAGIALHARGSINGKVIQQNLDWNWPFWIRQQFDPRSPAFLPRGFSFSQVNLTHRNWTAVGRPGCEAMPIIDPRGLVTPLFDGWSLDAWLLPENEPPLYPARQPQADQKLLLDQEELTLQTVLQRDETQLTSEVCVLLDGDNACCRIAYQAQHPRPGQFVLSLRPFNPEGAGLVERIALHGDRQGWDVDRKPSVRFTHPADRHAVSNYPRGDVAIGLDQRDEASSCQCNVGLASAAAVFDMQAGEPFRIEATVDLSADTTVKRLLPRGRSPSWPDALNPAARLDVPDRTVQYLYDSALRSLILFTPEDVYPGPYTYKRFWFRDAAMVLHALLAANLSGPAEHCIQTFPSRQTVAGYFHSQSGEWDSNGQVLWLLGRYCELTGISLDSSWSSPLKRAGRWIQRKRLSAKDNSPHAGLLPAGFSAEHLGTNDYYYWDDFWSIAGLEALATTLRSHLQASEATAFQREADSLRKAVDRSLERSEITRQHEGIPASPYRRMDSGAIGSIAAGYPLQLWEADDPRLQMTTNYLMEHCLVDDCFFLDIIHSGMNAYLTMGLAQALLRNGDARHHRLRAGVARAASPTGQWPEAIHPHTRGGCMGDGQHAWASAEWVLLIRNLFIREEGRSLIFGSGIPAEWFEEKQPISFGPTPTKFGPCRVVIEPQEQGLRVRWEADWRTPPEQIDIHCGEQSVRLTDTSLTSTFLPHSETESTV